jgi:hypothetical protein
MQQDRIEDLVRVHSLAEAAWLQERMLRQVRAEHTEVDSSESDSFAKEALIPALRRMGDIRKELREPDTVRYYLEALQMAQRLQSTAYEQRIAAQLAAFYVSQEPLDWNELSYWLTYATELCPSDDRIGQGQIKILHGTIALARSQPAEATENLQIALTVLPADPSDERAQCELKLGQALYEHRASLAESMQHVQSAIAWYDEDQNVYRASCARLAASRILSKSGESVRVLFYAGVAARGFASLAPYAEREALDAGQFAAGLEKR